METDCLSLNEEEWRERLKKMGEKPFRASILFHQLHQRLSSSYEEMTDLPRDLRKRLQETYPLELPRVEIHQKADDPTGTEKFLIRLTDHKAVECVLMKYRFGYSLCISSQAGCRMGCRFCASTLGGLERNLSAGEMLGQIYAVEKERNVKVSHVVVMGCGEPFDNYDNVVKFINLLHSPGGHNLSFRNITVSTCGLPDKIHRAADEALKVTLAVSLHAPNDEVRREIMNIARAVSMEQLMEACRYYTRKTNRRITFEYLLIKGINDSPSMARELCRLMKEKIGSSRTEGALFHINLIPVNPVKECGFDRPDEKTVETFQRILEENHVPVTRRREMGRNIDAACGQLRARAK